jgi:hypothetical protein
VDGSRQSPGFASEDSFRYPTNATSLPRVTPVTGCEFPRLQLRGSAGFSPASLLIRTDEIRSDKDARTKEVVKEQKATSRILRRTREVAL